MRRRLLLHQASLAYFSKPSSLPPSPSSRHRSLLLLQAVVVVASSPFKLSLMHHLHSKSPSAPSPSSNRHLLQVLHRCLFLFIFVAATSSSQSLVAASYPRHSSPLTPSVTNRLLLPLSHVTFSSPRHTLSLPP